MQVIFKKAFVKQYQKLKKIEQKKVDNALVLFYENPVDAKLKNHALGGKLKGKRAISAGFNLRLVFKEEEDYVVVFMIGVGSHNQVY